MPSGAASYLLRDVIKGPAREVKALGLFPTAGYLQLDDMVMALVTSRGVQLPNAMVVPFPLDTPTAVVGDGAVAFDDVRVTVGRWWEPRPRLGRLHRSKEQVEVLRAALGPIPPEFQAFAADPVAEAPALIGRGPGLTPAGDDVLAAAVAALYYRQHHQLLEPLIPICRTARTTPLSATLLLCATRGEVSAPVAGVLRAVWGLNDTERALAKLLRVGSTSGRDLAFGLLIGLTQPWKYFV